jgi:hypothetical protein
VARIEVLFRLIVEKTQTTGLFIGDNKERLLASTYLVKWLGRGAFPVLRASITGEDAMALIGYARVSTDEQTTDPQLDALRAAGCTTIHREHASGGDRSHPELKRAIERCRAGDVLVVVRIDRLARSLAHLLEIIEALDAKRAGFRSQLVGLNRLAQFSINKMPYIVR